MKKPPLSNARQISRRDFLKSSFLFINGVLFSAVKEPVLGQEQFPQEETLGRVIGGNVPVKARPDIDSQDVKLLKDDDVVAWYREIVGKRPLWQNQRFVETDGGYIYAPNLQPVKNQPNSALETLGERTGIWVEVTVPYVDVVLQNPPARSPWLKSVTNPRLYYSQVMWVDQIKKENDQVWYRVRELYGTFGDVFWAPAQAFRPLTEEDLAPIHPDAEEKQVLVSLTEQSLACYEGKHEVYYCRISSGGKFDAEGNATKKWSTPLGTHTIWRKMVSVHMTGGTTGGGYDLSGIGWTVLFSGTGVAIHSTFWHNSYGVPRSHGCINARPVDAQWIFRWTLPTVAYEPGDITISGAGSSKVLVVE